VLRIIHMKFVSILLNRPSSTAYKLSIVVCGVV
jgi:hypothetical protein